MGDFTWPQTAQMGKEGGQMNTRTGKALLHQEGLQMSFNWDFRKVYKCPLTGTSGISIFTS